MDIALLKQKIYALYSTDLIYNLEDYNLLIKECVDLHEMSAVISMIQEDFGCEVISNVPAGHRGQVRFIPLGASLSARSQIKMQLSRGA